MAIVRYRDSSDKNREIKQICRYADRHFRCWHPKSPSYVAFVQRLNRVSEVFVPLLEIIQKEQEKSSAENTQPLLIDLFPVAQEKTGASIQSLRCAGTR